MIVVPILSTNIDWRVYLMSVKQALGRSVTEQLDIYKMPAETLASFLVTLGSFKYPEERPNEILSDAGPILRHVHYGFLVLGSPSLLFEIMENTDLDVLTVEAIRGRLAVVTGNLQQWRTAIINADAGHDLLSFTNECLIHFEKIGLGQLWINYRKVSQTDGTFLLRSK